MGFFSKIWKKAKNIVKKVVKGVKKVASKVWKGVKSVVKKVGKAVNKLGPLASIAIGFIPGFQGLWANAGIWGMMGKGAITGFITSGGKLKGALTGAVMGGVGYAAAQGASAFKSGFSSLGENASISDKIMTGFNSVGTSTSNGVMNMYNSAGNFVSGGEGGLNYLTNTGESIYKYGADLTDPLAQGESVLNGAKEGYMKQVKSGLSDYDKQYMESNRDMFAKYDQRQMDEILNYAKKTGENLETSQMLWDQTGGIDLDQSFDYRLGADGAYKYTGEGLEHTLSSYNYPATGVGTGESGSRDKAPSTPGEEASYLSLLTRGDTGKYVGDTPLTSSQNTTGTARDQLFDVTKLGLMTGSQYSSLMAKRMQNI